jgi:hypothetical protein
MTDRLSDLLARRAQQGSAVHPSREGVQQAISRRATHRRRQRVIAAGVGTVVVLVSVGVGLAANGSSGDVRSGFATDPGTADDLPLLGIGLVGYVRDPSLDPEPTRTEGDLTYAVFTGDEVDVLGPMISVTVQSGDLDPGGTPLDLDGDGDTRGVGDGWQGSYPGGSSVTWGVDGEIASVSGHSGVSTDDVVAYARQLNGRPIDLDEMPAPEGLPNRQVVTFGPLPDFPSRTSSYQGPSSVVHVLTTREPGYFDLTRIVSTEGRQYERIGFDSSVLGPGEAILSPDDDGMTSALVRTDAGLTVHVFGPGLSPDALREAIEQDHLVDLTEVERPTPFTATPTAPPTPGRQTTTSIVGDPTQITDVAVDPTRITLILTASDPGFVDTVTVGSDPDPTCGDVEPSLDASAIEQYERLRVNGGDTRPITGWVSITLREPEQAWLPGPIITRDGDTVAIACDLDDGSRVLAVPLVDFPEQQTPAAAHQDFVEDPPRVVIDIGS